MIITDEKKSSKKNLISIWAIICYIPLLILILLLYNGFLHFYATIEPFPLGGLIINIILFIIVPVALILAKWYEANVFQTFWKDIRNDLKEGKENFTDLEKEYGEKFCKTKRNAKIVSMIGFLFLLILNVLGQFVILPHFSPSYIYYPCLYRIVIAMLIASLCSPLVYVISLCTWRILLMIIAIKKVTKEGLEEGYWDIKPLEPNRFGGPKAIGQAAINTSKCIFFLLIFTVPWLIYVLLSIAFISVIPMFFGILAIILIMGIDASTSACFYLPSRYFHQIAVKEKEKLTADAAKKYENAYNNYEECRGKASNQKGAEQQYRHLVELERWMNIQRNRFLEAEKLKTYPYSLRIIIELLVVLVFPIIIAISTEFVKLMPIFLGLV